MGRRRDLAIVRNLAGIPQSLDGILAFRQRAHILVARGMLEHQNVLADRRPRQPLLLRDHGKRGLQRAE